jgi:PAS domain-containing protein
MANHSFPDKRTERLLAEKVFGNKGAELSETRRLEQAGSCRREAKAGRPVLAAIVEFSEDAILSGNLGGITQSWNAGAQRSYGFAEAEIIGKPITSCTEGGRNVMSVVWF